MAPEDRALTECVHLTVTATAPQLSPKTWYGMPAYANADGKVVVFFQDSDKFNYRYSTLGFQDTANLDDGDMWPARPRWTATGLHCGSYSTTRPAQRSESSPGRRGPLPSAAIDRRDRPSKQARRARPPGRRRSTHRRLRHPGPAPRVARRPSRSRSAPAGGARLQLARDGAQPRRQHRPTITPRVVRATPGRAAGP
jgi:hypothetical protein